MDVNISIKISNSLLNILTNNNNYNCKNTVLYTTQFLTIPTYIGAVFMLILLVKVKHSSKQNSITCPLFCF